MNATKWKSCIVGRSVVLAAMVSVAAAGVARAGEDEPASRSNNLRKQIASAEESIAQLDDRMFVSSAKLTIDSLTRSEEISRLGTLRQEADSELEVLKTRVDRSDQLIDSISKSGEAGAKFVIDANRTCQQLRERLKQANLACQRLTQRYQQLRQERVASLLRSALAHRSDRPFSGAATSQIEIEFSASADDVRSPSDLPLPTARREAKVSCRHR